MASLNKLLDELERRGEVDPQCVPILFGAIELPMATWRTLAVYADKLNIDNDGAAIIEHCVRAQIGSVLAPKSAVDVSVLTPEYTAAYRAYFDLMMIPLTQRDPSTWEEERAHWATVMRDLRNQGKVFRVDGGDIE